MRIAFLGLGHMGLPMARNLAAAGHEVVGFDVFSAATDAAKMKRAAPSLETVVVPRIGHAPLLTEPAAVEAIDEFLARVP